MPDQFSFNFTKIEYEYNQADSDGQNDAFDFKDNIESRNSGANTGGETSEFDPSDQNPGNPKIMTEEITIVSEQYKNDDFELPSFDDLII